MLNLPSEELDKVRGLFMGATYRLVRPGINYEENGMTCIITSFVWDDVHKVFMVGFVFENDVWRFCNLDCFIAEFDAEDNLYSFVFSLNESFLFILKIAFRVLLARVKL